MMEHQKKANAIIIIHMMLELINKKHRFESFRPVRYEEKYFEQHNQVPPKIEISLLSMLSD